MTTIKKQLLLTTLILAGTMHNAFAETNIAGLLNAVEVIAQEGTRAMVEQLHQLFDYLRVQTADEAVVYVKQMHEDIGALINALGATNFHQALGNAKQYRSVFDQVKSLKDTIQP